MNIETREDGSRFKIRGNTKTRLCLGKDNTCDKEAKKLNKCLGCHRGYSKTEFKNRQEGDRFIANGFRYKFVGGQSRKLCSGENNTCGNIRSKGVLCHGHMKGTVQTKNDQYKKGDKMVLNGIRYMYNGKQKVQLCNFKLGIGKLCEQVRVKDGKCKSHSKHWNCKFTRFECQRIRIYGDYCTLHENNEERSRIKSKGEEEVATILDKLQCEYISNKVVKVSVDKFMYLDFSLPKLNKAIEYDGKQHFESVIYWGGDNGLAYRQENDRIKNEYCKNNNIDLLRIRYDDDNIEQKIKEFIDNTE